jgi:hypothetical protein
VDTSPGLPGLDEGPVSTGPSSFSRRRASHFGIHLFFAFLLVVEGLSTGVAAVQRAPWIGIYSLAMTGVFAARVVVGVLQFTAGVLIFRRRAPGAALGRFALLASAALVTLEFGANLAPHNLFPTYVWPVVGAYWAYALAGRWAMGRIRT